MRPDDDVSRAKLCQGNNTTSAIISRPGLIHEPQTSQLHTVSRVLKFKYGLFMGELWSYRLPYLQLGLYECTVLETLDKTEYSTLFSRRRLPLTGLILW